MLVTVILVDRELRLKPLDKINHGISVVHNIKVNTFATAIE